MIREIQRDSKVPSWILACRLTGQNTRSSCRPGFGFGWKVWKCAKLAAPPRTEKAQFQTFHLNSLLHNSWMSAVFQSTTCGSFKSPAKVGAGPRAHRHAWEATPSQKDPSGALLCSCWVLFTQNPQEPPVTATGKWGMLKQMGGVESCWAWSFFEQHRRKSDNGASPGVTVPVMKFFLMSSERGSKRRLYRRSWSRASSCGFKVSVIKLEISLALRHQRAIKKQVFSFLTSQDEIEKD